jgi:hypothetical protein
MSHPVIRNVDWRLRLMLIILHMMSNAISSFHLGLFCALYLDFEYMFDIIEDVKHTFLKVPFLFSRTNICINLLIYLSAVKFVCLQSWLVITWSHLVSLGSPVSASLLGSMVKIPKFHADCVFSKFYMDLRLFCSFSPPGVVVLHKMFGIFCGVISRTTVLSLLSVNWNECFLYIYLGSVVRPVHNGLNCKS